jgi:thiol-disulfide isomerase/thioredoxin
MKFTTSALRNKPNRETAVFQTHKYLYGMAVIIVKDDELREFASEKECLVVKYVGSSCVPCDDLKAPYERLSNKPRYEQVTFLRINADENPTAKKFVADQNLPLLATYRDGVVQGADTVASEDEIVEHLENLMKDLGF